MEEQRKSYPSSGTGDLNTTDHVSNETKQEEAVQASSSKVTDSQANEKGSPYYYSYGPYQSANRSQTPDTTTSVDTGGHKSQVQVTPPAPVKPLPFSSSTRQVGPSGEHYGRGEAGAVGQMQADANASSYMGQGEHVQAPPFQGNWKYNEGNKRRSTSFRTVFASFLAGMLVISALMYTADRTNLFTGGEAIAGGGNTSAPEAVMTNNPGTPFPDGAPSVAEVAKQSSPAVVKIETMAKAGSNKSANPWMNDPFFREFFGDSYDSGRNSGSQSEMQPLGSGTGFIFDKSGYILTNEHVIAGGELIQVTVQGYDKPLTAKLLGHSKDLDLAVLKIEGEGNFPTLPMGNSDATQVGDWLVAIGNPRGFDHTVTVGVLSQRGRTIAIDDNGTTREYKNLMQTDASINPGNSGGPLLNMKGEVVGMNVAVSRQAQGIGFAIPSNTIAKVVEDLKANKEIPKEPTPFIGATLRTVTKDLTEQLGIKYEEGSMVQEVMFGTPAYEADVRPYDIITGMNGTKYGTSQELIEAIQTKKVGEEVTFQVVRNDKKIDLKAKIGDRNKYENKRR
ncbi:S1C family serine protease [Paenibacillus sp. 481]|uniref:S1C family serine protease n=1 Tax=Paenibacillus sp. 481 TaxID=2835869 RepID=UPI001E628991|nr:trypsin-like peptidase domain-containing protein [Paenibacillus sp. 481]UHA72351.1 trypsin-like peptidase domain-containing protein [Paenibacillus sp. 481]